MSIHVKETRDNSLWLMMMELIAVMRTTRVSILDQKQRQINFSLVIIYKKEIMLKGIKKVNIFVVLHRTCFRREYMKE